MGQILHGSTTTTKAVRRAIQNSQASLRKLAGRYGINPKTVAKWRRRSSVCDARMGPREPRSTVLSNQEEALVVAFRKHTLLPLDDCLYALQATVPHLTRSSLHRCFQRRGISRLPETQGDKPARKKFKSYPIGYFHIDIAEVRTEQGKLYLFVAIDRTSKFAYAELYEKANRWIATDFLKALIKAVPYKIHTVSSTFLGDLGLGITVALILPVIAHLPSPGGSFTAIARASSEVSYTLYLTHFPFLMLIVLMGFAPMKWPPSMTAAGIYTALISAAIVWAGAIWWCFERNTDSVYLILTKMLPVPKIAHRAPTDEWRDLQR
jgi:transposase-like protein